MHCRSWTVMLNPGWAMPFAGAKFHNSRPHVLRTFQILEASETAHCLCWNCNLCCLNPSFFGLYRFPFSLVSSRTVAGDPQFSLGKKIGKPISTPTLGFFLVHDCKTSAIPSIPLSSPISLLWRCCVSPLHCFKGSPWCNQPVGSSSHHFYA